METAALTRARYRPDGKVRWLRVPPLLIAGVIIMVMTSLLLYVLFESGWYLIVLLPAITGGILGGLSFLLVRLAHCRKPLMAASAAFLLGLGAFLGSYHFGLMRMLPIQQWHRVDLLPFYIDFRMHTDTAVDIGAQQQNNPQSNVVMNYIMLFIEGGLMSFLPAGLAWQAAKRPYCSELKTWYSRENFRVAPGIGERVSAALSTENADKLAQILSENRTTEPTAAQCALDYVKHADVSPLEFPVYLTIQENQNRQAILSAFRGSAVGVHTIELSVPEALALRPLFAGLTQAVAASHEELRDAPAAITTKKADDDHYHGPVAQVTPVPEPYGGKIFTTAHKWMINLVSLSALFGFFGGAGLAALGAWLVDQNHILLAVPAFVLAAIGIGCGILFAFWYTLLPEDMYTRFKLLGAIQRRPDPLVDADDPDAIQIGITPREAWQKVQLEIASDVGLLKVDESTGTILIEGDHNRYRIPRESVRACKPECFFHPMDAQTQHWMIQLLVRTENGNQEILFGPSHVDFRPRTNRIRARNAERICERLMGEPELVEDEGIEVQPA